MMTPTISDLPTVEQQAEAHGLGRLLGELGADGMPPEPLTAAVLRERIPTQPSSVLREVVAKGFEVLSCAGVTGTALGDLRPEDLHWQFAARLALDELGWREARALAALAAAPPAWLVAAIGRPTPVGLAGAGGTPGSWLRVTAQVMAYRLQHGIADPTRALGANPTSSSPVGLARKTDWRYVMGEIGWSAGNLGERLRDPTVLAVFDVTGRIDPQQVLQVLRKQAAGQPRLSRARVQRIRAAPSHVLRRRVAEALGLLGRRPADRSGELDRLSAARADIAAVYGQELTAGSDRDLGRGPSGAVRRQRQDAGLPRRLEELHATIAQLRRAQQQRATWQARHEPVLAAGRVAAEELALREHEVLVALEQDPPDYLVTELGRPPGDRADRAVWHQGVRLIERVRTGHDIDDPARAFGRDHHALQRGRGGGLARPGLATKQHHLGMALRLRVGAEQVVGDDDLLEELFQQRRRHPQARVAWRGHVAPPRSCASRWLHACSASATAGLPGCNWSSRARSARCSVRQACASSSVLAARWRATSRPASWLATSRRAS